MKRIRSSAFTLIELLVVIAIIAILAAILFPVFAQAKTAAKKAVAISNMKQIGMAIMLYAEGSDDTASPRYRLSCGPRINGPDPSDGMSWDILVQPYTKNYGIFNSNMDSGTKYKSPYGDVRRSYGGAANFFRGYQGCASYNLSNQSTTPSMTYFPQPADTVMVGEARMLNATGNPNNYWTSIDWAAKTNTPGFYNAVFENTRNWTLGGNGTGTCTPNKICKIWCYIYNDYADGSAWAMADGHAVFKKGINKTSDGYNSGTEFKGYEHRAGTWDLQGEQNLQWTGGMSCMAWDITVSANGGTRGCIVPGETPN